MAVSTPEEQAREILDAAGVTYDRVYVYDGCTQEICGPMPRVIVRREGSVPVCYSIPELREAVGEWKTRWERISSRD